jgi:hypothetical protein
MSIDSVDCTRHVRLLAMWMVNLAGLDGSVHDAEDLEHAELISEELRAHEADGRKMLRDIASR